MTIGPSPSGLDAIQARTSALTGAAQTTVTITRAGVPSTDRNTLAVTVSSSTIWTGTAFITAEAGDSNSGTEEPGRRARTVTDYRARLPITATGIKVGDTLTVDTSDDAELDGRAFRVTAVHAQSYHAGRRLRLERIAEGART